MWLMENFGHSFTSIAFIIRLKMLIWVQTGCDGQCCIGWVLLVVHLDIGSNNILVFYLFIFFVARLQGTIGGLIGSHVLEILLSMR